MCLCFHVRLKTDKHFNYNRRMHCLRALCEVCYHSGGLQKLDHLISTKVLHRKYVWILIEPALQSPMGARTVINTNDWMSKRLKIATSLVNYPTIKMLYIKQGSSICDMKPVVKLPCGCEIQLIYVHIRKEQLPCVLQLTYTRCGMSRGRCARQQDGAQLTRHVCIAGLWLPWYPHNPLHQQWSIFIYKRITVIVWKWTFGFQCFQA